MLLIKIIHAISMIRLFRPYEFCFGVVNLQSLELVSESPLSPIQEELKGETRVDKICKGNASIISKECIMQDVLSHNCKSSSHHYPDDSIYIQSQG